MTGASVAVEGLTKTFEIRQRRATSGFDGSGAKAAAGFFRAAVNGLAEPGGPVRHLTALRDVNLRAMPGEVVGIIGRNGAGKSTLLKVLARVLAPTAGRVRLNGRLASLLELGLGFAPDMTVRENIELHGRLSGVPRRHLDAVEDKILAFAELADFRDVPLENCPSGSFIRLAFATLINSAADIILADEVLAVGDAAFRAACEARIAEAPKTGETVLFVSHDMSAIRRLCTRVVWIDKGSVRMDGATETVVAAYVRELEEGPAGEDPRAAAILRDVALVARDGQTVGALAMNADAFLEMLVAVKKPNVVVRVAVELWLGNDHVLTTVSPASEAIRAMGLRRAAIRIPAHFLNEATYTARASLLISKPRALDKVARTAARTLEFNVMNTDSRDSVWADWTYARPGIISPRLDWTHSFEPG